MGPRVPRVEDLLGVLGVPHEVPRRRPEHDDVAEDEDAHRSVEVEPGAFFA